jgi:hypothetical protein
MTDYCMEPCDTWCGFTKGHTGPHAWAQGGWHLRPGDAVLVETLAKRLAEVPWEAYVDAMDSNDEAKAWHAIAEAILSGKP